MIGNLIAAIGIATSIGMTQPHQPPLRSGVTTYEITYQYDTNEVNTWSDLIAGNIYHCDGPIIWLQYNSGYVDDYINLYNIMVDTNIEITNETNGSNGFDAFSYPLENNYLYDRENVYMIGETYIQIYTNILEVTLDYDQYYTIYEYDTNEWILGFDFVPNQFFIDNMLVWIENEEYEETIVADFILKSDYQGYLTAKPTTTTEGLYNSIESFIETYLYGNDKLKETEYTIMGTTYNMAEWLAHTTTIVLISLIIIVLVMFIKWLFKQIGNTFNLVGVLQ